MVRIETGDELLEGNIPYQDWSTDNNTLNTARPFQQLTRQTFYALKAVEFVARQENLSKTKTIAEQADIPPSFLAKIIVSLTIAGIFKTHRGVHGGVELAQDVTEFTLKQVLEAIDQPNRTGIRNGEGLMGPWFQKILNEMDEKTNISFAEFIEGIYQTRSDGKKKADFQA